MTCSGSLDGGFEELEEPWPCRASSAAVCPSKACMTARMADRTLGGVLSHISCGIGGVVLMPPI